MAKLTLNDISTFVNDSSAVTSTNANYAAIETAMEKTLSRDGTSPNVMEADFDMNSNDILNVGTISVQDLEIDGDSITDLVDRAETAATNAEASELAAASSASSANASALAAASSEASVAIDAAAAEQAKLDAEQAASDAQVAKIEWQGAWSALTNYSANDAVSYDGKSWIAIQASLNHTPADDAYWDLLADKGVDGSGSGDFSSNTASSVDGEIVLFSGTSGKTGKRATTTGILKGASGVLSAAVSGTDYAPATSGSAILKGNGSGGFSSAASGTDYAPATSGSSILKGNGSGGFSAAVADTDYTANAFKTIAVSGQSDVVADSAADTLTLAAGSNITITTNATTDTITITGTASAPGMVLLQTVSASGAATVDLETTIDSTYESYLVVGSDIRGSSTGSFTMIRFKASTYQTSNYAWENDGYKSSGSAISESSSGAALTDGIYIHASSNASATNDYDNFQAILHSPSQTSRHKSLIGDFSQEVGGTFFGGTFGGSYTGGTGAITGVRIMRSSGNITGEFKLYGLKKS
jgi:hypothetical protein